MLVTILNEALKKCPEKIAVSDQVNHLTYAQLDRLSAHIARSLKERSCKRIAVSMDRGCDWIAVFIAILRSGLTYIPISPQNKQEFIKSRLQEANADILIQNTTCLEASCCPSVSFASIAQSQIGAANISPEFNDTDFAYCIFTSGSTGKPKAVEISYANLVAHHENMKHLVPITDTDTVLQFCAISFDVSIEEILSTLLAHATLLVYTQSHNGTVDSFHDVLDSHQVNVVNIPTAFFNLWVEHCKNLKTPFPDSLHTVLIGSEACMPQTIKTWVQNFHPRPRLLNAYGLTETTITNAIWQCPDASPDNFQTVPIGKAIGDNQLVILNENNAMVEGEGQGALGIIGKQLCDHTHPANHASADRVVRIAISNKAHADVMLTGDLAYKDKSDNYHVIGRTDSQVKINGYRINLNTLANTFSSHKDVVQCIVKLVEVGQSQQLCLYVQFTNSPKGQSNGIMTVASNKRVSRVIEQSHALLPRYALPKFYCEIEAFEFTQNGKIDTRSLPVTLANRAVLPIKMTLPAELEALLHKILGYMQLTEDTSFVKLGGDSISAQRFSNEARRQGYEISVKSLLSDTSLVKLLRVQANPGLPTTTQDEQISKFPTQTLPKSLLVSLFQQKELWPRVKYLRPATPTQSDMLTHSQLQGRTGDLIEQVEGRLHLDDVHRFKRAWQRVIENHDGLNSVFVRHSDDWYFLCLKDIAPQWHEVNEPDLDVPFLLDNDRQKGFTQLQQSLMRFTLVNCGANEFHFIWTYHHALLDGWSDMNILDQVFGLLDTNNESQSPSPSIFRYLDYLHDTADETATNGYWQNYLKNARPFYLSEHFYPRTPVQARHQNIEREVVMEFTGDHITTIKSQLAKEHLTLSTMCHGAVLLACSSLSGVSNLVIGSVQSARDCQLSQANSIRGLMINHVPIMGSCEPHKRLVDLLKEIQQDIYNHMSFADHYSNNKNFHSSIGVNNESLYDTVVVVENLTEPQHKSTQSLTSHAQSGLPLSVYFWPTSSDLKVQIKYRPAMLDEQTTKNLQNFIKKLFVNFNLSCNLKELV